MSLIYKATSPSGKSYIGYTTEWPKRKRVHEYAYGTCKAFHSAIKKYGKENFQWEIIYEGNDALEKENEFIIEHNTIYPNGYNIAEGGGLVMTGRKHSPETIKKMSNAHKYRNEYYWSGKTHSDDSKKKMSESRKKNKNVKKLASNAGRISAQKYKDDPARQKAHSERMKQSWADRKSGKV
jgi:group I intron endonuclease